MRTSDPPRRQDLAAAAAAAAPSPAPAATLLAVRPAVRILVRLVGLTAGRPGRSRFVLSIPAGPFRTWTSSAWGAASSATARAAHLQR